MLFRRQQPVRRKPRQQRSTFTFESILDAASQLLASGNPDPLHMVALAKRAGVSSGTLYQYFVDRNAVLNALLERIWERAVTDFRLRYEGFQVKALDALLEELSSLVAELAHREHGLRVVVHAELRRDGVSGPQTDVSQEWIQLFSDALRAYLPADEDVVTARARAMLWVIDGMVDGVSGLPQVSLSELRTGLLSAWRGLLAQYCGPRSDASAADLASVG